MYQLKYIDSSKFDLTTRLKCECNGVILGSLTRLRFHVYVEQQMSSGFASTHSGFSCTYHFLHLVNAELMTLSTTLTRTIQLVKLERSRLPRLRGVSDVCVTSRKE